jgi:hypothetical protein
MNPDLFHVKVHFPQVGVASTGYAAPPKVVSVYGRFTENPITSTVQHVVPSTGPAYVTLRHGLSGMVHTQVLARGDSPIGAALLCLYAAAEWEEMHSTP